jgi:hypothetical protein
MAAQSKIARIPSNEALANATDDETPQITSAPPLLIVHDDPSSHALKISIERRWDDYDHHLDVVWNSRVEDWFDREDILRWGDRHCRGILSYIGHQNQSDVNAYLGLIQSVIPQDELQALSKLSVEEVFCEGELKFPGKKLLQYVMYSIRDPTTGLEEHRRLDEQNSHNAQNSSVRHNIDLGSMWLQNFYNTTGETFEQFATRTLAETSHIPDNLFKAIERFSPGLLQDPTSQDSVQQDEVNSVQELTTSIEILPVNLENQDDSETQVTQPQEQSTPKDDIDSKLANVDPVSELTQDATNMTPQKQVSSDNIVEASTAKAPEAVEPSSTIGTFTEVPENLPASPTMQTPQARFNQPHSHDNRRTSVGPILPVHHSNAQPGPSSIPEWHHRGPRRDVNSGVPAPNVQLQQPPAHFYSNASVPTPFDRVSPANLPGFGGLVPPSLPFGVPTINTPQQQVRYPPYIQPQNTYIHGAGQPSFGHQFANPHGYQSGYLPTYGAGEMSNQPFFAYPQDYVDALPVTQGYTPSYTHPNNRPRNNSMGRGRRGRAYSGVSNDSRALYNPRTGVLDHVDNYGQPVQSYGRQPRERVNNFGQERNHHSRDRNQSLGQDRGYQSRGATVIAGRRFSRYVRPQTSQNAGPVTSPQTTSNSMAIETVATSSGPALMQAGGNAITESPPRRIGPTSALEDATAGRDSNDARRLMSSSSTDLEAGETTEYELYDSPTRRPKLTSLPRNTNRNPRSGKASKKAKAKGKGRADESDVTQESFNINNETDMERQDSSNVATSSKIPLHNIPSGNTAACTSEASSDVDGTLRRTSEGGLIFEFQATTTATELTETTAPKTNIEKTVTGSEATLKPVVATSQSTEMLQDETVDIQSPSNNTEKSPTTKALEIVVAAENSIDDTATMANKEPCDEHSAISEPIDKVLTFEPTKKPRAQTTGDTKTKDVDEALIDVNKEDIMAVTDEDPILETKDDTACNNDDMKKDSIGEVKEQTANNQDDVNTVPMKISQKQDVLKEEPKQKEEKIHAVTLADWQAAPAEIQKREKEEVKAFTEFYKKKLGIDTNSTNTNTTKSKSSPFKFEETFKQTAIEGSMGPRRVLSKTSEYHIDESNNTINANTPVVEEQIFDRDDAEVQLPPKHEAAEDVVTSKIDTTDAKAIAETSASTETKPADDSPAETSTVVTLTEGNKPAAVELEKFSWADDKDTTPLDQGTAVPDAMPVIPKADEAMVSTQSQNKGKSKQIEETNDPVTTIQDKSQKSKAEETGSINPFAAARKQAQQAKQQAKAAKKKEKKQQQQKRKSTEKVVAGASMVMDNKETEAGPSGKDCERVASFDWLTPEILDIATKFAADQAEAQAKQGLDKESPELCKNLDVPVESATSVAPSDHDIKAATEQLASTVKTEDVVVASTTVVEITTTHTPIEHQAGHGDDAEQHEEKKQPAKKKKKSSKRKRKPRKSSGDSTIEAVSDIDAKESRAEHDKFVDNQGQGESKHPTASSTSITPKTSKEKIKPAVPLVPFNPGVKGTPSSEHTAPTGHNGGIDSSRGNHLS